MKKIFFFLLALGTSLWALAQEQESRATINKIERPAISGEYLFSANVVEAAVLNDMKARGFGKGDSYKGFQRYTDIVFTLLSPEKIDFYFKVTGKSKKESEISTLTVAVSKGPENFISSTEDAALIDALKQYMAGLNNKFVIQKLQFEIDDQTKVVEKAEKKLNNLKDEGDSLKKRLKDTQDAIARNLAEQDAQKAQAEAERKALDALKAKLK